jgi:hypothetical protein
MAGEEGGTPGATPEGTPEATPGATPAWLLLVGPAVASVVALGIAVAQHRAAHAAARADVMERAALTAITASDGTSLIVTNFGRTPVFDVRVEAWRDVMGRDGEGGPFISVEDEAYAMGIPSRHPVLAPGEAMTFTYTVWKGADGPVEDTNEFRLSSVVKVLFRFSDAAGRRWERQENGRARFVSGPPLPGMVSFRTRARKWRRSTWRELKRSLRFGFKGKGFTRRGRKRRREGTALVSRVHRCGLRAYGWIRERCARVWRWLRGDRLQ